MDDATNPPVPAADDGSTEPLVDQTDVGEPIEPLEAAEAEVEAPVTEEVVEEVAVEPVEATEVAEVVEEVAPEPTETEVAVEEVAEVPVEETPVVEQPVETVETVPEVPLAPAVGVPTETPVEAESLPAAAVSNDVPAPESEPNQTTEPAPAEPQAATKEKKHSHVMALSLVGIAAVGTTAGALWYLGYFGSHSQVAMNEPMHASAPVEPTAPAVEPLVIGDTEKRTIYEELVTAENRANFEALFAMPIPEGGTSNQEAWVQNVNDALAIAETKTGEYHAKIQTKHQLASEHVDEILEFGRSEGRFVVLSDDVQRDVSGMYYDNGLRYFVVGRLDVALYHFSVAQALGHGAADKFIGKITPLFSEEEIAKAARSAELLVQVMHGEDLKAAAPEQEPVKAPVIQEAIEEPDEVSVVEDSIGGPFPSAAQWKPSAAIIPEESVEADVPESDFGLQNQDVVYEAVLDGEPVEVERRNKRSIREQEGPAGNTNLY